MMESASGQGESETFGFKLQSLNFRPLIPCTKQVVRHCCLTTLFESGFGYSNSIHTYQTFSKLKRFEPATSALSQLVQLRQPRQPYGISTLKFISRKNGQAPLRYGHYRNFAIWNHSSFFYFKKVQGYLQLWISKPNKFVRLTIRFHKQVTVVQSQESSIKDIPEELCEWNLLLSKINQTFKRSAHCRLDFRRQTLIN